MSDRREMTDEELNLPSCPYMCYCHWSEETLKALSPKALTNRLVEDAKHHAYVQAQQFMLKVGYVKQEGKGG